IFSSKQTRFSTFESCRVTFFHLLHIAVYRILLPAQHMIFPLRTAFRPSLRRYQIDSPVTICQTITFSSSNFFALSKSFSNTKSVRLPLLEVISYIFIPFKESNVAALATTPGCSTKEGCDSVRPPIPSLPVTAFTSGMLCANLHILTQSAFRKKK